MIREKVLFSTNIFCFHDAKPMRNLPQFRILRSNIPFFKTRVFTVSIIMVQYRDLLEREPVFLE